MGMTAEPTTKKAKGAGRGKGKGSSKRKVIPVRTIKVYRTSRGLDLLTCALDVGFNFIPR